MSRWPAAVVLSAFACVLFAGCATPWRAPWDQAGLPPADENQVVIGDRAASVVGDRADQTDASLAQSGSYSSTIDRLGYSDRAVRGQSPGGAYGGGSQYAPGSADAYQRGPMRPAGGGGLVQPPPSNVYDPNYQAAGPSPEEAQAEEEAMRRQWSSGASRTTVFQGPGARRTAVDAPAPVIPPLGPSYQTGGYYDPVPPGNVTPLDVYVNETRTGRFQFGVGVNSNAGVNGNITIDERNFDLFAFPRSWDDIVNGVAWRGRGQGFRIEAMPGSQVSRYMVSFTEPYLAGTDVTLNTSAYYFQRFYQDWAEQRIGGRVATGYRLTPDLSAAASLRYDDVKVYNPRVGTVPQLNAVLGSNDVASGRLSLVRDTRNNPFFATEGNYMELAFEQGFGQFSFPRGEVDARQFINFFGRPDGTGAHVLALYGNVGVTGSDTPIFENYFIGGYGTLRGFRFRGVGPTVNGVKTGGRFKALGTVEYSVPITADDMVRAVAFVDAGTIENSVKLNNVRVAPGFGFLINVPALGPAPLSINFSFPLSYLNTDERQMFSFQMGASR